MTTPLFISVRPQLYILLAKNILDMHLDEKLNFNHQKIAKANNGIGIIQKLGHVSPRQ